MHKRICKDTRTCFWWKSFNRNVDQTGKNNYAHPLHMHTHILFRLHSRSDAGSSVKVRVHRWLHQPSRSRTSGWRSWWRAIEQLFGALSKLCNVVQYGTTAASCRSYALHGTSVRCITVAVIPRSSWNNCFTENYNFWIRILKLSFIFLFALYLEIIFHTLFWTLMRNQCEVV